MALHLHPHVLSYDTRQEDQPDGTVQRVLVVRTALVMQPTEPGYDQTTADQLRAAVALHMREHPAVYDTARIVEVR